MNNNDEVTCTTLSNQESLIYMNFSTLSTSDLSIHLIKIILQISECNSNGYAWLTPSLFCKSYEICAQNYLRSRASCAELLRRFLYIWDTVVRLITHFYDYTMHANLSQFFLLHCKNKKVLYYLLPKKIILYLVCTYLLTNYQRKISLLLQGYYVGGK